MTIKSHLLPSPPPLINNLIGILGLIFKLHRDTRFSILHIINLIVYCYFPITKASLRIPIPTYFKYVVATAHTRSNIKDPTIAQLEQFAFLI